MDSTHLFDLLALRDHLGPEHQRIKRLIKRWCDAHSASSDLRIAAEWMEAAMRLHLAREPNADLVKMSLIHSAIMAYDRALERSSKVRGKLSLTGRMAPVQLEMHGLLDRLRNEAIGHHGYAGTRKPWSEDLALIVISGQTWQPLSIAKRQMFDRNFARAFLLHLQGTEALAGDVTKSRTADLQAALNEPEIAEQFWPILTRFEVPIDVRERLRPLLYGPRTGKTVHQLPDHD